MTKEIDELIEAGELATQGIWEAPFNGVVAFREKDIGGFEIHKKCNPQNNAAFIASAANARPAIKAMAEENKRLREALEYCAIPPGELHPQNQAQFLVARAALKGE